jgi:hypothetical protein
MFFFGKSGVFQKPSQDSSGSVRIVTLRFGEVFRWRTCFKIGSVSCLSVCLRAAWAVADADVTVW